MYQPPKMGDIFAIKNRIHNKWLLWQVIKDRNETIPQIGILILDWFSNELPNQQQLQQVKPLWIDHHSWKGAYEALYVIDPPPASAQWIANIPPVIDLEFNAYGGSWYPSSAVIRQFEWLEFPEAARKAYKKALASDKKVSVMHREINEKSTSIWLAEKEHETQWKDLDLLPALNEIHFEGDDLSLIAYLEARPILENLSWDRHPHQVLDLRATHLRELAIDISSLHELYIPNTLRKLSLTGDYTNINQLKIYQENYGKFLLINMHYLNDYPIPDFSLKNLDEIWMRCSQLDIETLVKYYPHLSTIRAWGNPGILHNLNQLKKLTELDYFQLMDFFGFTEQDFPRANEMPKLDWLSLTSIPEAVGKWAKKEYKAIKPDISKLRNDAWLAANMNNPFRAWDGREGVSATKAKKAFDAYKKASMQIERLNTQPHDTEAAKKIIADFVGVFNKIDTKAFIDTLEREEIGDVFRDLVTKMNVDRNTYDDYFDSIRDF